MNSSQFNFALKVFPELVNWRHFTIIIIIHGMSSTPALVRPVGLEMTIRGPTGETHVTVPRAPRWSTDTCEKPAALFSHHVAPFYTTRQSLEVTSPLCSQMYQ